MKPRHENDACWFTDNGAELVCESCGRVILKTGDTFAGLPFLSCPQRPGLGDYVASALDAIGITKDRVEAIVGGPCGCPERQAAMNDFGAKYLGLPPGNKG